MNRTTSKLAIQQSKLDLVDNEFKTNSQVDRSWNQSHRKLNSSGTSSMVFRKTTARKNLSIISETGYGT